MRKKRIFAQVLCLAMAGSAITPAGTAMAETWETEQEKNYLVVLREDAASDINTMLDGVDDLIHPQHQHHPASELYGAFYDIGGSGSIKSG